MAATSDSREVQEDDVDALLADLENDDPSEYRAQRLKELKDEAAASKGNATTNHNNAYVTLKDDDETLRFTTEHERAVVHFYHPDFARCSTMDHHCQGIAAKHAELGNADVAFARVDVKNAPFLVEKLGIRVLPCVLGFFKGIVKGRVTGFEGISFGNKEDSLTVTSALEAKMVEWTVLRKRLIEDGDESEEEDTRTQKDQTGRRGISGRKQEVIDDEDDWD
jgi:thioredoxin-like negative regulator of GroEL